MMKGFITTVLFFGTAAIYGQYSGHVATNMSSGGSTQGGTTAVVSTLLGPIEEGDAKRTFKEEDFQGSPYENNAFVATELYYKDEKVGDLFYRYNALNEEIEIKQSNLEEEGIRALARDKQIQVLNNGKPMSFKTFVDKNGNTINGYLTLISDGKTYDLYKRLHVKYTEGTPAQNSFVKATPSRFAQFEEYYFQKDGVNRIDEVPLKKGAFLKLIGKEHKDAIKSLMKEEKLDLKKEQHLIRVFSFLNK